MAKKVSEFADSPAIAVTYPEGKLLNETAPGANDGTQLRQGHIQDMWNVFNRLMTDSTIAYDNAFDTDPSSQFFDALVAATSGAVGDVVQTFLTEAQFFAQPGRSSNHWVRCNGQNVAGSKYQSVTGLSTVPNMTNKFIRDSPGSDSGLRSFQADQVGGHSHGLTSAAALVDLSNGSNSLLVRQVAKAVSSTSCTQYVAVAPASNSSTTMTEGTKLLGDTDGVKSITSETRPDNVTVNTFIKIN